ncbi:MAG: hypothetical protein VX768_15785 [Planctomycetota bacterium]|nr:hypothetical protein [Planctomycetota bacterium]
MNRFQSPSLFSLPLVLLVIFYPPADTVSAQLTIRRQGRIEGTIVSHSGNTISVKVDGKQQNFLYTLPGQTTVPLTRGQVNLRHQNEVRVSGTLGLAALSAGQKIEFDCSLTRSGRSQGEVSRLKIVPGDSPQRITSSREARNSNDRVPCQVNGTIESIRNQSLVVAVGKREFAPQGKLRIRLSKDLEASVDEKTMARVSSGDLVEELAYSELSTGDLVVNRISIRLERSKAGPQRPRRPPPVSDEQKYLKLSDQPTNPRDLRSQHFLLHTDLSDRSSSQLLDKLERMLDLISRYYGRSPNSIIECFVVNDLAKWNEIPLEPAGVQKIREKAGVTLSRSLGQQRKAVVYACGDHGVVQHEAVHAFCFQTFGSTGPTWYSEGMAEMGQYWRKDELAVNISPPVIRYLTGSPPKKMLDIVAAGQVTGDSWQAYAWRWALCHLLANNPNYSTRFKSLGLNMMSGGKASFESVYGDVAKEISFEYDLFVKNFGNGYRVDLCSWDWKTRAVPLSGQRRVNRKIDSRRGWQSAGLKIQQGKKYQYIAVGQWSTSPGESPVSGAGTGDGKGRLKGVVFSDYELSAVMEMGEKGEFVAEKDGYLFLRCGDKFTELADNSGTVTVHFRRAVAEQNESPD